MARPHRFRLWLKEKKLSYEKAAAICAEMGRPVTGQWLKMIALRFDRPGYDFAKFLSEDLCKGEITVPEFMEAKLRSAA